MHYMYIYIYKERKNVKTYVYYAYVYRNNTNKYVSVTCIYSYFCWVLSRSLHRPEVQPFPSDSTRKDQGPDCPMGSAMFFTCWRYLAICAVPCLFLTICCLLMQVVLHPKLQDLTNISSPCERKFCDQVQGLKVWHYCVPRLVNSKFEAIHLKIANLRYRSPHRK